MSKQIELLHTAIEGAPIALAPDLSCIPVIACRDAHVATATLPEVPVPTQVPAGGQEMPRDITLEPLALILARPNGVERMPLGARGAHGDAASLSTVSTLADRMTESTRQACVGAVFGAPTATADGYRVALRRAAARLWLDPGDPEACRIEILSSETLGEATIAGGAGRSALGMSAEGVYH